MKQTHLVIALLALALGGCASPSLYDWGQYEEDLFTYYHEPSEQAEVVADHTAFLNRLDERGEKPAPGLLAEAGTFYLEQGDIGRALDYYRQEYQVWPESRPVMGRLIDNLEDEQ